MLTQPNVWLTGGVNVRIHGAKGDDSTDDSTAISAANTYLKDSEDGGGNIYFPPGTYLLSSAITLGSSTIQLMFAPGAKLKWTTSPNAPTINGYIFSGRQQIFDGASVTFGNLQDSVMPEWWGGAADDGTTDNQVAIERAIATSLPVDCAAGTYVVKSTIAIAANTRLSLFGGRGQQFKTNETSGGSIIKFSPTTTPDTLFDASTTGHLFLSLRDIVFTTNDTPGDPIDPAVDNKFIEVAVPGAAGTLQGSTEAPFDITGCAFRYWGGTVLGLFGEMFGVIERNHFHKCAQAIHIDGQGEITIRSNFFEEGANDGYSDTGDAYILINKTVVKFMENVFNLGSVDRRHTIRFNSCKGPVFMNNKMERANLEASSKHELFYDADTSLVAYGAVITGNSILRSSLTSAAHTGRLVNFATSAEGSSFRGMHIEGNSLIYSTVAVASVPCIDFSACVDSAGKIQVADGRIGINYWENADNPLVKLPAFVVAQGSINNNIPLYGFTFGDADMISEVSIPLTLLANQTGSGTQIGFHGTSFPRVIITQTRGQVLPVSIAIETDGDIVGTLDIFLSGQSGDYVTGSDQPLQVTSSETRFSRALQPMAAMAQDGFSGEVALIAKYNSSESYDASVNLVIYLHYLIFKHHSNKRVVDIG